MSIKHNRVLFIDRDGVINVRLIDDYVTKIEQFQFLPGVLEAIAAFSKLFDRIFIVTNQQGVAKGLMTEDDLKKIHAHMLAQIEQNGGNIDAVYYCHHHKLDNCECRKPKNGMFLQALKDYPDIKDSIYYMVGDTKSDMGFGKNIGATNVMIANSDSELNSNYNFVFPSLKKLSSDIHLVLG